MKQNGCFVKLTASTLILTFSYSQLLFAADVRQMLLDAKTFFEEQDAQRPHGMAASDLQAAQDQQQAAVDQQQLLQDFQNTSFSLTTPNGDVLKYVGDKLSSVERPDGTRLAHVVTDASGNIQNADLQLSDGSIQIFQNGQVVGYQTPDGNQVIYTNGEVTKVISRAGVETLYTYTKDAQGNVTETTLDNAQYLTKYDANKKIKEATRKSDNQKIYYANGIIQKIVNADGSQTLFNVSLVNGDSVVTPQGAVSNVYIDAAGNKFNFSAGTVTSIVLTDGSTLDSIVWDASNKIDSANLTQADGQKFIYQAKKLTRSYDVANVVTNYTYNATSILVSTAGNTWEYLLDKTPVKYTALNGDVTTYHQSGTYKGFKATENLAGILYTYIYSGSGSTLTVQKKRVETVVLPNSLYQTSARSVRAWDGQPAWYAYEQPYGKDYLQTHWADQWVEYSVNMSRTGDLKIALQASDSNGIPTGYTAFSLQFSVNGVLKGTMSVPAAGNNVWKDGSLTLTGIAAGTHTVRLKFANWLNSGGQQTDFKFRNIAFTRVSTITTSVSSGYQSTPITARVDTIKNSTIVKPASPGTGVNSTDFTSITYDPQGALKQVLFKDGSKLVFDQGMLKEAYDATGKLTSFDFVQSSLSNVLGTSIAQSNLTSVYNAEGKLSSIKTGDLTIHYKADGTSVDWIEKTDGTELWDLVFDASGALTGASIYAPTGEIRTYAAGKLVNLRQSDQSQLFYANDKVTQLITPEKLTYNFDYTNPSIIQATLAGTPPVDTLTPIKMEYDTNFNLKKVVRQNQEILNYLNTDLMQIDAPSTAPKVFSYTKDAQGKVLSYTVTQGNILTYYDANNQPTRAVISPDTSNPNTLDVSYQYGKIRQIKKNGVVTFTYSYSFESDGTEMTVVEDVEENTTKTYKGGDLVSSLDKATNVLSSYGYQGGKVSKVSVTRFGRLLHTYDYSYSGTDTLVEDEAGVVRTYDANEKLIFLERDGQKFAYTYSTQTVTTQNGPPVVTETLLPNSLYQTTARSVRPWDGQPAWYSYEQPYGKDYLVTHWADSWVEYTVNIGAGGDLRIALQATDDGTIPSGYPNFLVDFSVDGTLKGTMSVPAAGGNVWNNGVLTLTGLSQGSHVIRLKFANFLSNTGGKTDFKFRNISFTQVVTTSNVATQQISVTSEDLLEKRLSDGSLIRYTNGKVSQIDQADGRIFKDILKDENGMLKEVRLFQNAQDAIGTKFNLTGGEISKVTLSDGTVLDYSYEKDAAGTVTATWIRKGAANLKYNAQGVLTGLKLDGVMTPAEVRAGTTDSYPAGYFGPSSIDGNFSTAQWNSIGCAGVGGCGAAVISEHAFPQGQAVTGITFQMAVSAYASGNYTRDHNANYYVQVLRNGVWETVTGSVFGCGGGDGSCGNNSGVVTLGGLNLDNVTAIRAYANGFGNASGGEGSSGGTANIYELQYALADLANLNFTAATNTNGQITGYSFTGHKGTVRYDAQGNLTQSNASYAAVQQALTGQIQKLAAVPYKNSDLSLMRETLLDTETMVSQEYSENGTLETQTKSDGTVTVFENNKPSRVLDSAGKTLIQYSYDAQGNPIRVYLKNARDTLPNEVLKAKENIQEQRAASLRALAAQKNLAYQSIQNQYRDAQAALENQIGQQQTNYDNFSSTSAKGKLAKNAKADALAQIAGNIDTLRAQLTGLYDQEADAYAALDAQVMTLSNQIEADAASAVTNLGTQEANMKREILKQEVSPVVYDYYRRILGRDPDTTEYNYWVGQVDYNSGATLTEVKTTPGTNLSAALSTYINAQPELAQRQTYVNAIKQAVTSQINSYLAMTQTQKEAFAATLGLTPQDLIPLSQADSTAVLNWLNTRSLHFGQSAFIALETLLDQKGKVYTRETLARQCILIDVLTGVISPLDDGDLVISVFALNKAAELYGVTLKGANLSWDDLRVIVPSASAATSPRVIAHINGNHYVIITAMTADSITYIDPGIGKDKQNESVTVAKAGFLKAWQGNVTLESSQVSVVSSRATVKVLSAMESKNIRGAFWGSLLGMIGSILTWIPGLNGIGIALTAISTAVSAIEGDWISAISSVITLGLGNFGNALKGAFDSVVKAMGPLGQVFQAAGNVIGGIYKAVTGLVSNISNALGGFMQSVGISKDIAISIAKEAVSAGLTIGATKGLEAIGVNPQMAGFVGALTSGAIIGGLSPETNKLSGQAVSRADAIKASIQQAVTIGQFGNFGMQMGLDPIFTRILGNSLAAIQGTLIQNPSTTLDQSFTFVKNQLGASLAQYSLEKLGNSLGLNSLISAAIAAPIASNLAGSLTTTKWTGQVDASAKDGISINDDMYFDKRLGSNVYIPGPGTVERTWWDGVFNFLRNSAPLAAASAASAYYLTKPSINGSGQPTTLTTTEMPIPAGAATVTYQDYFTGQSKAGYQINSSASNYIVYDKATGNPVKRVSNGVVEEGVFEGVAVLEVDGSISVSYRVNPNYISKGQIKYTADDGGQARFKILDSNVQEIYIDVASPSVVLNPGTTKDVANKVLNGVVKILSLGLELSVANGAVSKSTGGQQGSEEVTKRARMSYVFGNGFENERRAENTPDPLIQSYVLNLEGEGIIDNAKELFFYLYEMTDLIFNATDWLSDFEPQAANTLFHIMEGPLAPTIETIGFFLSLLSDSSVPQTIRAGIEKINNYLGENWGIGNNLVQEAIEELDQKGPIEDGIAFVHSGATAPLLKALQIKPYDIETVIIYEGPHPDYNETIVNPNLKRVVHVQGTGSWTEGDYIIPFLDKANFGGVDNINILIKGAFHNDFAYNAADYIGKTGFSWDLREQINQGTNKFMQLLYERALSDQTSPGDLVAFFESLRVDNIASFENGTWIIDPLFIEL